MSDKEYMQIIKRKCNESAYQYLMKKRGSKGREIKYQKLKMADYLLPNQELDINEKRKLFEIRNKMTDLPSNICSSDQNKSICLCGNIENEQHIYDCKYLSQKIPEKEFETVFSENIFDQKSVLKHFEQKMEKRKKLLESSHEILNCDPLHSVHESLVMDNK